MIDERIKMTAAILTLSETFEGLYSILRKDLQFRVEQEQTKIVEDFLPPRMKTTTQRFEQFQKLLEELEKSEITPLKEDSPVNEINEAHFPDPARKFDRDSQNPPQEYKLNQD